MIKKAGGKLTANFDTNTLGQITERYPAGSVKYIP